MAQTVPHPTLHGILRSADHHLTSDDRLMELLATYHPVTLPNEDKFSEKLTWCLANCQGKFRDIKASENRIWYFQNEQDASLFALKWA